MTNNHSSVRHADRLAILWTAVFSMLAHGYRYLSLSFSGDSMLLAQVGEEAYQSSLGRFLQPVYWQIRGYITAPFLIGLFATAFLALSAMLVIRLMRITKPLHIMLVCGVLTANETMAVSNATYLPWTDVYALALLLSLLGVYCFMRMRFGLLISPVLYCLSLGLYQSYLPAAAAMLILLFLLETLEGESPAKVWQRGLLSCGSLVLGLLLYALVLKIVLAAIGTQASQDYNGVARVGQMAPREIPALLWGTFIDPLRLLFGLSDTPVMTWHITTVPSVLNIALFAFASVFFAAKARKLGPVSLLTCAFLLLVLPLGINFIQFISHGISSGLTIYAYNFLYLLPVALLAGAQNIRLPMRLVRAGICALLCAFFALNIRTSNSMSLKRDLEFSATTAAMSRLLDQAERTQGYLPGETPVVLMGMLPSSSISMERGGFEQIARAQGMRYTYGASYETANYWYLQMALGEPVNLVSHQERMRLSEQPQAQSLPAFPQAGCCAMIDGHLYIRIN